MSYGQDRIYKKIEVIGVSAKGIDAAIEVALQKARASVEGMSWFEVEKINGHITPEGKVGEYQVLLKVAFAIK